MIVFLTGPTVAFQSWETRTEAALLWCCLFFPCCVEGGICPPDTWAAGVAPSLDSLALVVFESMQRCHDATVSKHFTTNSSRLVFCQEMLDVVGQGRSGMPVSSFLQDKETCEDSSELSSWNGSLVPGDTSWRHCRAKCQDSSEGKDL